MRLPFRVTYRWIPRRWWRNITHIFDDITAGIANVVRWLPMIWFDRDWDWCHLATLMEYKLRRMSKLALERGHHLTSKREGREQLICAELLRRLRDDNYFEEACKRFGATQAAVKHAGNVQRNDQRYLGVLIGKHLNHWWD